MKKLIYPAATVLLIAASAFTVVESTDWKVNDDYTVKFSSKDPSGEFKGLKGTIQFDPAALENAKFDMTVDVATINTGNGMKNTHAKSEKWFDAEKYPTIHFVSTSVAKTATAYETKGTMEIHGVQKEVTIPFTFENNVFSASFDINRLDYEVNTAEPEHGAAVLKVDLNIPVSK
jgi:polyisoprenoid-binding protein YceI